MDKTATHNEGDMQVWWKRGWTGDYAEQDRVDVTSVQEAAAWIRQQIQTDLNTVTIVWNAGGLEVCEDGKWWEWYDDNGSDIFEWMDAGL